MTDLAEALSRGGVGDPNKYKLKCSNTSFLWNTINSSKFCNTSSWVRGGGNNDQHRNQLLALLEKLLQTQRAGSPAVLCVCAESMRSPKGLQAKERDVEKEKRGGIAATGSPNAFVAKPPSPSCCLETCVGTRISQGWAATSCSHSLCLLHLHDP